MFAFCRLLHGHIENCMIAMHAIPRCEPCVCCTVQCALHTDILLIWPKLWKWVPNIGNDMPPEHTQRSHCTYGFAHSAHTHTHTQVTHSHKVIHTNECTLTDWIFCMFLPLLLLRCRCGRSMLLFFVAVAGHCWYFGRLLYSLLPHFFFPNFGCVLQPINRCYPFRRNAVCLRRLFVSILLFSHSPHAIVSPTTKLSLGPN